MKTTIHLIAVTAITLLTLLVSCSKDEPAEPAINSCGADTLTNSSHFVLNDRYHVRMGVMKFIGGKAKEGYFIGGLEKTSDGGIIIHGAELSFPCPLDTLQRWQPILNPDSTLLDLVNDDVAIQIQHSDECKLMLMDIYRWLK